MQTQHVVDQLKQMIDATAGMCRVQAIFGDATTLSTQTIVPVGAVFASYGGGEGGVPLLGGSGAGVTVQVLPLGFIHESEGAVRFTAIVVPELGGPTDLSRGSLIQQARARLTQTIAHFSALPITVKESP